VVNKLAKRSALRIVGLAAGAAAVTGAAVLVTASAAGYNLSLIRPSTQGTGTTADTASQPSSKASTMCADFIAHFAGDLSTSPSNVNAAFQRAVGQTLIDEVKNGAITQKQADAINKRIAGQAPCALAGGLKVPSAGAGANLAIYRQALLSAAASALGITDTALKTDLGQGMTLSQIAAAQKPAVTEALFRSRLIMRLTPLLDTAVTNKQLTSAQEQMIIKRLKTGPIPYWKKPMPVVKSPATAPPSNANA
jgi:hypothetical protein